MRASRRSRATEALRGERGSVAMIAAVGMALLLVVTVAFVSLAQLETKIGVNHLQEIRAAQAAESGARRVFRDIADGSEDAQAWLNKTQPVRNGVAVVSGSPATYTVTVKDDSGTATGPDTNQVVVIESTGNSGGASATVRLYVNPGAPYAPQDAVGANDYLRMDGLMTITGTCGRVHVATVNADSSDTTIDIQVKTGVNPVVTQGISTSGISNGGTYRTSATGTAVAPTQHITPRPVPTIDTAKYAKYADYVFGADAYAYKYDTAAGSHSDPSTWTCTSSCTAPAGWIKITTNDSGAAYSPGDCVLGWYRAVSPTTWKNCNPTSSQWGQWPGTFYVKGNVDGITTVAQPASSTPPYRLTLITEGYIKTVKSLNLHWDDLTTTSSPKPSLNPDMPTGVLFVAGTDIVVPGDETDQLWGMIASHEQIEIDNTGGTLHGFMLMQNATDTVGSPIDVAHNNIKGNFLIDYDCGSLSPAGLSSPGSIRNWGSAS